MNIKTLITCCLFSLVTIQFFSGCIKNDSGTGLPAIYAGNDKSTGSSARDLLSDDNFATLTIEIQYMTGFAPDAASLNNLTSFLNSLVHKPGGITITQKEIEAEGKPSYSINDVASIEQKDRTVYNTGNKIAIYVLITDGAFDNPAAVGASYRNTSLCLFGKTLFDNSGGIGQLSRTKLETTVCEHEFGHLLGLVDLGSAMINNHKDADHGNHCKVKNCLMYYEIETIDFLSATDDIPTLDSKCLADLQANGGK